MNLPLIATALWVVLAFVLQSIPSRDNHWRRAYALIVLGIPLLGWVTLHNGPWIALGVLLVGVSVLRWPVIFMLRRARQRIVR